MKGDRIVLGDWMKHVIHLESHVEHDWRCSVCNLTAKHITNEFCVDVRKDIEFHNKAMAAGK